LADSRTTTFAQRAMESAAVVRIYESRLWRRSFVMRFALGLSFEREYQLILESARLDAASDVLDLACGSGIYSRPFARAVGGGRVVGLDLSPAMLAHARRLTAKERLANLFFVRGDAQRLPFPAACFDLVNCCGALHLFPEPARALAEVSRVLRLHGRFTTAVVRRDAGALALLAGVLRRLGVESFSPRELEVRLREAGFDDVHVHHARALWLVVSARKGVAAM
jgi:ubiquinone/menaquinone biosynthesis C-methylase UbiE